MVAGAAQTLSERGWLRLPHDPAVARWAAAARAAALPALDDPALRTAWLDCGGTWFVGVDALPNDAQGAVAGSDPLPGPGIALARALYGSLPLHPAQVSVTWPGYPRPRRGEGAAAFRYRLRRDAAHVDGLLPVGAARRRMLRERHAFILGLPLTDCDPGASPLVVWDGSPRLIRDALTRVLADHPAAAWPDIDLTEAYQTARREVFAACRRIELPAWPGEATLLHRHALHGVAPWAEAASAPPEGRMIAYFRPQFARGTRAWLDAP